MSEGKFGEPWEADIAEHLADCPPTYRIFSSDGGTYEEGDYVCETASRKLDARVIACVNSLAGIEDPAAFMEAVRKMVKAFEGFHIDVRCRFDRRVNALAALRAMLPKEGQ